MLKLESVSLEGLERREFVKEGSNFDSASSSGEAEKVLPLPSKHFLQSANNLVERVVLLGSLLSRLTGGGIIIMFALVVSGICRPSICGIAISRLIYSENIKCVELKAIKLFIQYK
uniref:Uncharacterized protein n=1 Tax=Glossina brevipalpis TaxID=37001 RepID=A0A1A9WEU9_9MUSC